MSRRRTAAALAVLGGLLATGLTTGAGTAAAAVPFTAAAGPVVVGDVTGDGVRDRTTLGRFGDTGACAAQVTRGTAAGGWGATATVRLPVRAGGVAMVCPDLGVVLRGPLPPANRLAVTFRGGAYNAAPSVQVFSLVLGGAATYRTGVDGQYQPAAIGTQDFDGDGYGDVWETTDQGEGFDAYLVRSTSTTPRYSSPTTAAADPQFVDLNRGLGTDVLLTTDAYPSYNASAVAVDGRTGATQVLAAQDDGSVVGYRVRTVDIDHDAYPDLRVESVPDAGSGQAPAVLLFLNRSQGGRFTFVPSATGPTS